MDISDRINFIKDPSNIFGITFNHNEVTCLTKQPLYFRIIGIYSIVNTVTKQHYVGQSNNVFKRWKLHLYDLNKNQHHNKMLQKDYNKYGPSKFYFQLHEQCSPSDLNNRENYYIMIYGKYKYIPKIYNVKHNNLSINNYKKRPIKQIDPYNFTVISYWDSMDSVAKYLNISNGSAIRAAIEKYHKAYGYYWCDADKNFDQSKIKHLGQYKSIKIAQIDINTGKIIKIWRSANHIQKTLQIKNKNIILRKCRSKKIFMNYYWEIHNDIDL